MTISIRDYRVNFAAGTLTFREDDMYVKEGGGQPLLRAPYTQVGETITLNIPEVPRDLEVTF